MRRNDDAGDGHQAPHGDAPPPDPVAALVEVDALLAALAPDLAPERVPGRRIGSVVTALGAIERRARGLRLVLRKAAADTGAWKAAGARSAAEHVAKQEGISVGQARAELDASKRLARLPAARDAVASGDISVEKAKAVAEAGAADPSAEAALVAAARSGDLRDTQDEARRTIVRADERSGRRAVGVHRRRSLKTWLSVDGEGHGIWNIPAESHHRFLAALEPYRRQAFRDARANGVRLSDEALMADALDMLARDIVLDLADDQPVTADAPPGPAEPPEPSPAGPRSSPTTGPAGPADEPRRFATEGSDDTGPRRPATTDHTPAPHPDGVTHPDQPRSQPGARTSRPAPTDPRTAASTRSADRPPPRHRHRRAPNQVMVMVDYDALVRGHARDGDTCEVTGLGPVPVSLVEQMMRDCLLRLVVTGTDVTVISSERRYIPADLRAAIWARDGGTCVVPGCHATRGLEVDHCHRDFAKGGPTALWNNALLCKPHHIMKTLGGWRLAGSHEEGWSFTPPSRPTPAADEPP